MCQYGFEICSATQAFSVSKAPGLSAISLNLSQRYFKEFVRQTRAGNVYDNSYFDQFCTDEMWTQVN